VRPPRRPLPPRRHGASTATDAAMRAVDAEEHHRRTFESATCGVPRRIELRGHGRDDTARDRKKMRRARVRALRPRIVGPVPEPPAMNGCRAQRNVRQDRADERRLHDHQQPGAQREHRMNSSGGCPARTGPHGHARAEAVAQPVHAGAHDHGEDGRPTGGMTKANARRVQEYAAQSDVKTAPAAKSR